MVRPASAVCQWSEPRAFSQTAWTCFAGSIASMNFPARRSWSMAFSKVSTRLASSPVSVFGDGDGFSVADGEVGCVGGAWAADSDPEKGPARLATRTAAPIRFGRQKGDMGIAPRHRS